MNAALGKGEILVEKDMQLYAQSLYRQLFTWKKEEETYVDALVRLYLSQKMKTLQTLPPDPDLISDK